jgi:transcriptional regulator with XRE-family HTH domain
MVEEEWVSRYNERVGERLRGIRLQKGMSLHDAEVASTREFKASVLGAYERGERSISVPRLQRLAHFYDVPVDHLLPRDPAEEAAVDTTSRTDIPTKVRIDLVRLNTVEAPETPALRRFLDAVQMQRGDFNGKVLTIRGSDIRVIASVLDLTPEALYGRMDELGIRVAANT